MGLRLYTLGAVYGFFLLLDITSLSLECQTQVPEMKQAIRPHFLQSLSLSARCWSVWLQKKKKYIDCKLCRDYLLRELLDGLCSCNFSDGRISFTPERDVYFTMCENKALDAAERGGHQMPFRPGSGPSSSPSGLTPSGLDLCHATGPFIHLIPASRGKQLHVYGSQKLVCVSRNQKAVVLDSSHSMLCFFSQASSTVIAYTYRVRSLSK